MKKIICYALIIMLLFMLFLPPILRHFGKDLYQTTQIPKSKNSVMVLNCSSLNEKINTSYLNGNAYNLQYQIKGNYIETEELNTFQNTLKTYAKITYDNINQSTDYKVDFNSLTIIPESLKDYAKKINEQKTFYTNLGYTCQENSY